MSEQVPISDAERNAKIVAAIDDIRSDAMAIFGSLGILGFFVHDLEQFGEAKMLLSLKDNTTGMDWTEPLERVRSAMSRARTGVSTVVEDLGDWFNNNDACSDTMIALSTPVYEVLSKRREGVSLDD